jgi:hypothetical protein
MEENNRVKIKRTSEFYGDLDGDGENPLCEGEIIKIEKGELGILVRWDNEHENSYNDVDLELLNSDKGVQVSDTTGLNQGTEPMLNNNSVKDKEDTPDWKERFTQFIFRNCDFVEKDERELIIDWIETNIIK